MINLLHETLKIMADNNKKPEDVLWVGYFSPYEEKSQIGSWEDFERLADFEYDNGYGGNEIKGSLVVVGTDWWLERGEYDGSEWWEFKTHPAKPENAEELTSVRQY